METSASGGMDVLWLRMAARAGYGTVLLLRLFFDFGNLLG